VTGLTPSGYLSARIVDDDEKPTSSSSLSSSSTSSASSSTSSASSVATASSGARVELHPDGNSLDWLTGLVVRKTY
jgi:hypothetical protein